jgi:hypothetical protein
MHSEVIGRDRVNEPGRHEGRGQGPALAGPSGQDLELERAADAVVAGLISRVPNHFENAARQWLRAQRGDELDELPVAHQRRSRH